MFRSRQPVTWYAHVTCREQSGSHFLAATRKEYGATGLLTNSPNLHYFKKKIINFAAAPWGKTQEYNCIFFWSVIGCFCQFTFPPQLKVSWLVWWSLALAILKLSWLVFPFVRNGRFRILVFSSKDNKGN